LRTKTNSFKRNIQLNTYDVISLTETWLFDGISDSELFDDRYLVWRVDRDYSRTNQRYGGGVLLAVRKELTALGRPDWHSSAEDVWVTILTGPRNNRLNINICTLYLCSEHNGNSFNTQLNKFTNKLNDIMISAPNDIFIVLGDFNLPNLDWHLLSNGLIEPRGLAGETQIFLFDTLNQHNLDQFNLVRNANNRILDLAFSNQPLSIEPCLCPLAEPEDAHHKSLTLELRLVASIPLASNIKQIYHYKVGNYEKICTELNDLNWDLLLNEGSLDDALSIFNTAIYNVRDKFIPHKTVSPKRYPHWFSPALIKVLKEKRKYSLKYKTYGSLSDFQTFSLLRRRAKMLEDTCYKEYISRVENAVVDNPKYFWSYAKSLNKGSLGLPAVMNYDSTRADTGESICNLFAEYFKTTFLCTSSPSGVQNITEPAATSANICDIEINPNEVLKLLKSVDLNKGAGPDFIPPILILNCAESLVKPLCIIFRRSLSEGVVPEIWKSAFVTPVHKCGDRSNIKNYRPISKLCIFAKTFEKIVHSQVYSSLKLSFITEQHGFVKKRSTDSNLLIFCDYASRNMESGGQVDAIYTDFSKAFDRIDHQILLQKLLECGIHGNLFRWFTSYVQNRSQAVAVNGFTSSWVGIPSGVPQGSLLGPLLFVIFINDIHGILKHSHFLLYADDTKIYRAIKNINDCLLLQDDLNRFTQYCVENRLDLNVSKCHSMSFTRKLIPISFNYSLNSIDIINSSSTRDLGLYQDPKLIFDIHIDKIVKKASRSLGFIMRSTSKFKKIKPIKVLYCSFVRSILEYASVVWNPCYDIYIKRIESIQRKFLKFLQFKTNTTDSCYHDRCVRHHFLPLDLRRKVSDLVYLTKILSGSVDSPELIMNIDFRIPRASSRHYRPLAIPQTKTNYRQNSYFVRAARSMNELCHCNDQLDLHLLKPAIIKNLMASSFFAPQPTE
jgi:hypothetical protein